MGLCKSWPTRRLNEGEDALREAKAALVLTPDNAEAHKNAGLALTDLRKPDAAEAERIRGKFPREVAGRVFECELVWEFV